MNTEEILVAIDAQIVKLQQVRELIAGAKTVEASAPRRGRPKGSTNKTSAAPAKVARRVMSAEGKARIAAAQKARWAAQRKAAEPAKKVAQKATPRT